MVFKKKFTKLKKDKKEIDDAFRRKKDLSVFSFKSGFLLFKERFVLGLKKHKSEILRFFLVVFIMVFIFFASIFIFQLRSSYAEQIIMENYPQYIPLFLRQGDNFTVAIETEIRTNLFCASVCDYSFVDLSSGTLLENDSFTFYNYEKHVFEKSIFTNALGSGQELYLFELSCVIEDSRFCSRSQFPVVRSSIVTLNFEPSEVQQLKRAEVELLIGDIEKLYASSYANLEVAEAKISNLSFMKTSHLESEALKLRLFESVLLQDLEMIEDIWISLNYSFVLDELMSRNVLEKSLFFNENSVDLVSLIDSERELYNFGVGLYSNLVEDVVVLKDLRRVNLLAGFFEHSPSLFNLYSKTSDIGSNLAFNDFESYSDLSSLFVDSINLNESLYEYYLSNILDLSGSSFNSSNGSVLASDLYDNLSNSVVSGDLSNLSQVLYPSSILLKLVEYDLCFLNQVNCSINLEDDLVFIQNLSSVDDLISASNDICFRLISAARERDELFDELSIKRESLNQDMRDLVDFEKNVIDKELVLFLLSNLSSQSIEYDILLNYYNMFNSSNVSEDVLGVSFNQLDFNFNSSLFDYFLPATFVSSNLSDYLSICQSQNYEFDKLNLDVEPFFNVSVDLPNVSLIGDVAASCCFEGVCVPCCDYDECRVESRRPLILLHGYSFYSFNSAFHSVNAYTDFARRALADGLYFPAGVIGPAFNPDYVRYDLSRPDIPPLFKATYYDVLRFDELVPGELNVGGESISDYGVRLNDLVELVLNVTGASELDIVAHSMGGLVLRSYIDQFGDDSLNKIVLVGTPNKGVPSRMLFLCKFFGGQTECDELYERSAFIEYLNSDANLPEKEVHMIIGEGCNTFGADGDGIVQTSSAKLNFTTNYFFNSSCDLIDNFHRDMIKPSKYPEIYDLIVDILTS
ncbi:MAG: hypothetical protein ACLFN8_02355 [Candidatus Woesearchaeota archaeon]